MTRPTPAALQFARVHGADASGPRGRARGRLHNVNLLLEPGVYGFVGAPEDGTAALCELCAGARAPKVGVLTVQGREPSRDPALRRSIGALLPRPALPTWGRVDDLARRLGAEVPWAALGLGALAERELSRLSFAEARAVELALALNLPRPVLVVLFEPDVGTESIDRGAVRHRIASLAEVGVPVVIASADVTSMRTLTEQVYVLEQGQVVGEGTALGWPAVGGPHIVVWLDDADDHRRFSNALEGAEATAWDAASGRLAIAGADLRRTARAVARAVTLSGVEVRALRTEGLSHPALVAAAHEHRREAMAHGPSGPTEVHHG